ncbi:hypothetical protein CAOG_02742 [Capsaspora owczarzaki ATCC 30864]|nr:hypothetical protein CAOG_02742 [Capsaspora owczarzaki ATCC 30864]|eukprot:XP_004349492.2 hypothetical protein CAOG_02742 [Capsaspora owczarzaki ATCC 30864]
MIETPKLVISMTLLLAACAFAAPVTPPLNPTVPRSGAAAPYRSLGSFSVKQPGFLNFAPVVQPGTGETDLWLMISSFTGNPLGSEGEVYAVPNISSAIRNVPAIAPVSLLEYLWPNEVAPIPREVFGDNFVTVAGGFLVPGKSNGVLSAVRISDVSNVTTIKLSTDKKGYFYHMCEWYDVNGDGKLDVVAARATKPLTGAGSGELLWLEQPRNPFTDAWTEHVLFAGPDVFFRVADVNNDGVIEIFAAQFFTSKLVLYTAPRGNLTNPSSYATRVIDDSIGPLFDVKILDLNADGRVDLLITDHTDDEKLSGVYGYEIPNDLAQGTFVKHIIAQGFKTTEPGTNQASPGAPEAFYPQVKSTSGKPSILLAGDGAQSAYLISPNTQTSSDWSYELDVVIDVKHTVGQIAVEDVDGDGWSEFFVPDYTGGEIYVYTFAP